MAAVLVDKPSLQLNEWELDNGWLGVNLQELPPTRLSPWSTFVADSLAGARFTRRSGGARTASLPERKSTVAASSDTGRCSPAEEHDSAHLSPLSPKATQRSLWQRRRKPKSVQAADVVVRVSQQRQGTTSDDLKTGLDYSVNKKKRWVVVDQLKKMQRPDVDVRVSTQRDRSGPHEANRAKPAKQPKLTVRVTLVTEPTQPAPTRAKRLAFSRKGRVVKPQRGKVSAVSMDADAIAVLEVGAPRGMRRGQQTHRHTMLKQSKGRRRSARSAAQASLRDYDSSF